MVFAKEGISMQNILSLPIKVCGMLLKNRVRRSGTHAATALTNDTLSSESEHRRSADAEIAWLEVLCSFAQAGQRTFPML
jgi:hypothetical protein